MEGGGPGGGVGGDPFLDPGGWEMDLTPLLWEMDLPPFLDPFFATKGGLADISKLSL